MDLCKPADVLVCWLLTQITTTRATMSQIVCGSGMSYSNRVGFCKIILLLASCSLMLLTQCWHTASSEQVKVTSAHRQRCCRHLSTYNTKTDTSLKKYLFNNQPSLIAKVLECRSCSVWITCEGLPAVLSLSFSDLFPAAIVSLSAAILLLFLSDRDYLWHWDTVTDTWTTHTCTQSS